MDHPVLSHPCQSYQRHMGSTLRSALFHQRTIWWDSYCARDGHRQTTTHRSDQKHHAWLRSRDIENSLGLSFRLRISSERFRLVCQSGRRHLFDRRASESIPQRTELCWTRYLWFQLQGRQFLFFSHVLILCNLLYYCLGYRTQRISLRRCLVCSQSRVTAAILPSVH